MRGAVKKWGNSASVRIPTALLQAARLRLDQVVEIRAENDRLVIEPVAPEACRLDDLLAAITPANLHDEVGFGAPVGREAL